MAIFGKKKEEKTPKVSKKETKATSVKEEKTKEAVQLSGIVPDSVLVKPHLSEKVLLLGSKNVYVFRVAPQATKYDVSRAIVSAYGVTPVKVNIAKIPAKKTSRRLAGRRGTKSALTKAYVYLKKGDTLNLV